MVHDDEALMLWLAVLRDFVFDLVGDFVSAAVTVPVSAPVVVRLSVSFVCDSFRVLDTLSVTVTIADLVAVSIEEESDSVAVMSPVHDSVGDDVPESVGFVNDPERDTDCVG